MPFSEMGKTGLGLSLGMKLSSDLAMLNWRVS